MPADSGFVAVVHVTNAPPVEVQNLLMAAAERAGGSLTGEPETAVHATMDGELVFPEDAGMTMTRQPMVCSSAHA